MKSMLKCVSTIKKQHELDQNIYSYYNKINLDFYSFILLYFLFDCITLFCTYTMQTYTYTYTCTIKIREILNPYFLPVCPQAGVAKCPRQTLNRKSCLRMI